VTGAKPARADVRSMPGPYDLSMARPDPLAAAFGYYAAEQWGESGWRQFGRETGTSDILSVHPRLYRSLSFGDDDYADAALDVAGLVLEEGVGEEANEAERMSLIAEAIPDLPTWIAENAPARTKKLFREYLDARDPSEIPVEWSGSSVGVTPLESSPSPAPSRPLVSVDELFPWDDPAAPSEPVFVPFGIDEPSHSPLEPEAQAPVLDLVTQENDAASAPKIFIVHGHDEAALNSVRVYVFRETGIMPTSLAEEASVGQTIIEKFESYGAKTTYVIVLLTPDDVGQTVTDHDAGKRPNPRARQNVVLELGYFIGVIGRKNIVVVNADVERPSDLAGVGYVQYPGTNWKDDLRKELIAARLTK
jgi:predicted nucleotide-binding protein